MEESLLDTSAYFALVKNEPLSRLNSKLYLEKFSHLSLSHISKYEILRGFKIKHSVDAWRVFQFLELKTRYIRVDDPVILKAADIYADLHKQGLLCGDADILIAATALEHNLTIVTRNEKHFARIPGLKIANWSKP